MKRGEIYYIYNYKNCGNEIAGTRPGIIVSNDALNATSQVVEVVYLTTKSKKELPTHVTVEATGRTSTALCEQVCSVSVERIGSYCGTCTDEEMAAIGEALLGSLGLDEKDPRKTARLSKGEEWLIAELGKLQAERDRYAKMLDVLLGGAHD